MKSSQKIIDFAGMEFRRESHPSSRLRRRSAVYRERVAAGNTNNNVAKNVRSLFQTLLGF